MKTTSKKNWPPPHLKEYYLNFFSMTSHLNSQRTTDIKPEMLSVVHNGNGTPHDKYNIRGNAHARTNRKDDNFIQRRLAKNLTFILEWGQGTCSLTKQTWCWAYSWYFFPACCLLRFAAFLIYKPKQVTHNLNETSQSLP